MPRSTKKGPYIDEKLIKKISNLKRGDRVVIKTWSRAAVISPEMVGFVFGVYNGKQHIPVSATEEMVGHKLGEFSATTKFIRHGGKIQKAIEEGEKVKEEMKTKEQSVAVSPQKPAASK